MKKNFKLTIEYDGTGYHGWQRQKKGHTIQQAIEDALFIMTKEKISLIGSGRTDAGVHALNQVANFRCDTHISEEAFLNGINSLTKDDIVIKSCKIVEDTFHSRFSAKSKIYRYQILNSSMNTAIGRQYFWIIRKKLDFSAMESAVHSIIGEHDFKAFEASGSPRASTVRNVLNALLIKEKDDRLIFEIQATGFLRYMVRNIVGTLVEIGLKKKPFQEMQSILISKDRQKAGATAPAQGLFLYNVCY